MNLRGRRLLITAGPTRAAIDAVRCIVPRGTGRLGALVAEEVLRRGASVTYVYGPSSAMPALRGVARRRLVLIAVDTVEDLMRVFREELPKMYDAVVHSMAVLDFAPAETRPGKLSSAHEQWVLRLVPTPKAIEIVKELAPQTFLVGFKLEVAKSPQELAAIALEALRRNRCDLVVANDQREIDAGRHTGYFIDPLGSVVAVAQGKVAIARALVQLLADSLERPVRGDPLTGRFSPRS